MVIEKKQPLDGLKRFVKKIGKRNLIIAGALVLIVAAVCINWAIFAGDDESDDIRPVP